MPGNAGYGQNAHNDSAGPARAMNYNDQFNLAQGAKDWLNILARPRQFFSDDRIVGSPGLLTPLVLMLLYCVPVVLSYVINGAYTSSALARMPQIARVPRVGPMFAGGGVLITILVGLPIIFAGVFLASWVIHLVGLLFANQSRYSASFRALVFAWAPLPILGLIASLFPRSGTLQPHPVANLLVFIGLVWFLVLLVMAVSSEQQIGTSQAVGVVIISGIGSAILAFGIGIALFIVFAILIAVAAAGAHGMIPLH